VQQKETAELHRRATGPTTSQWASTGY